MDELKFPLNAKDDGDTFYFLLSQKKIKIK